MIASLGKFFMRHYQYWITLLSVGVAWVLGKFDNLFQNGGENIISSFGGATLFILIGLQLPNYFISSDKI